jgi:hypothetical protein
MVIIRYKYSGNETPDHRTSWLGQDNSTKKIVEAKEWEDGQELQFKINDKGNLKIEEK